MLGGVLLGAMFVTPLVIGYLLFIRWVDRFEPEPWWLILDGLRLGSGLRDTRDARDRGASHTPPPRTSSRRPWPSRRSTRRSGLRCSRRA